MPIPAHGQVKFKPGGYHVMILQLKQDLNAGGTVKFTLVFSNGQTQEVTAVIRISGDGVPGMGPALRARPVRAVP